MSYDEHLHQEMHRYLYARGDVDEPCPEECGCEWCEEIPHKGIPAAVALHTAGAGPDARGATLARQGLPGHHDTPEASRRAEDKGAAVDTSSPDTAAPHSRDTHPGNWPGA